MSNKAPIKTNIEALVTSSVSAIDIDVADRIPLSGRSLVNIPASPAALTHSHSSSSPAPDLLTANVNYPAVGHILDDLHKIVPALDLPQFNSTLSDHGIMTVNDVRCASNELFIAIRMPASILDIFIDCAGRMVLSAEGYGVSQPRYSM